jgi:putative pyruvate formate lyase activating enzyme
VESYANGDLAHRAKTLRQALRSCTVCAHRCGVDRTQGELGECRTGAKASVSAAHAHFGEEAPLVGTHGSGTIFFTWCNLHCEYCANYEISAYGQGREVEAEELAGMMLQLQEEKCHNINLVSPSHVVPQIVDALLIAAAKGLHIPLVYNTGGYDNLATLRLLEGIVDIYMPDMKHANAQIAQQLCGAPNYPRINQAAVKEMYRQVGDLEINAEGVAVRGLLVRHLVLPYRLAGTEEIVEFVADEISKNTYFNLMDQYHPCFHACTRLKLDRTLRPQEYAEAVDWAREAGLVRVQVTPRLLS